MFTFEDTSLQEFMAWLAEQPEDRVFDTANGSTRWRNGPHCPIGTWMYEAHNMTGSIDIETYLFAPREEEYTYRPYSQYAELCPSWATLLQNAWLNESREYNWELTTEEVVRVAQETITQEGLA